MKFPITALARSADTTDLSSATTAQRTGPAGWAEDGQLDIPFDRPLTATEVAAVTRLLTSPTNSAAELRRQVETYLAITAPTTAQNTAVLKSLSRLALEILDRPQ